jgi:hypothetical protein
MNTKIKEIKKIGFFPPEIVSIVYDAFVFEMISDEVSD